MRWVSILRRKELKFRENTAEESVKMGAEIEKIREEFQNILQKK